MIRENEKSLVPNWHQSKIYCFDFELIELLNWFVLKRICEHTPSIEIFRNVNKLCSAILHGKNKIKSFSSQIKREKFYFFFFFRKVMPLSCKYSAYRKIVRYDKVSLLISSCQVSDIRAGGLPKDMKLMNQLMNKHGDQLEEKSLTICSGTDYININYLHVICPDANTAKVSGAARPTMEPTIGKNILYFSVIFFTFFWLESRVSCMQDN